MSTIKFYTIEDWVSAYLKEWGYEDKVLTIRLSGELKKDQALHPDDVVSRLNQRVINSVCDSLHKSGLTDEQKLNYFKMIFLNRHLSQKYDLFENINEAEKAELSRYFHQFLASPDLIVSDMQRQSIKTYHPIWRLKKTLAKGVKAVVHSVKKK